MFLREGARMKMKYDLSLDKNAVDQELKRLTNLIYKLLPNREENLDWAKPLETIIIELAGMDRILIEYHSILFPLICKLEGIQTLTSESDFLLFRRTIFECLGLIKELREKICQH